MYIKNKKKKIEVTLLTNIFDKIKSFRFKLDNIEEGICFPKKRIINTYMFCQNVDIIFTNKTNKILKIERNVKSEKFIFGKRKGFFIYVLKENTTNDYNIDDTLNIIHNYKEKEYLKKYNKEKKTL